MFKFITLSFGAFLMLILLIWFITSNMIKKIDDYLLSNDDIIFVNGQSNSITFLALKWVFLMWILIILKLMMLILMKVILSLLCMSGL